MLIGASTIRCYDPFRVVRYQAPCTKEQALDQAKRFQFNILDKVVVPSNLAGEFVLSFRLDSEQTPAIWSQCSDITITA